MKPYMTPISARRALRAALTAAALCVSTLAAAGPLLGAGYGSNNVYTFNTSTGAATAVAGSSNLTNGLGYNSATGVLYGLETNGLYTVNPLTGVRSLVTNLSRFVTELEYNPLNGLMYTLDKSTGNGNVLAVIDTSTGTLNTIGSGIAGDYLVAFAINGLGEAYVAGLTNDTLYRLDLGTGAYSVVATGAFGSESGMTAMAFDDTGTLYGVGTYGDRLGIINTTTGAFSTLGGFNGVDSDVRAMEFIGDKRGSTANGVPEPGTLGIVSLGLAGLASLRRRRAG